MISNRPPCSAPSTSDKQTGVEISIIQGDSKPSLIGPKGGLMRVERVCFFPDANPRIGRGFGQRKSICARKESLL